MWDELVKEAAMGRTLNSAAKKKLKDKVMLEFWADKVHASWVHRRSLSTLSEDSQPLSPDFAGLSPEDKEKNLEVVRTIRRMASGSDSTGDDTVGWGRGLLRRWSCRVAVCCADMPIDERWRLPSFQAWPAVALTQLASCAATARPPPSTGAHAGDALRARRQRRGA